nr:hypothetical protein [Tanacetum cinerariifolium]
MGSTMDFTKFVKNRLKKDKITKAELRGPTFKLLKGTCRNSTELEKPGKEIHYFTDQNKGCKEIVVKRGDMKEYTFREADFSTLHLNDIKDMFLLYVQRKIHNLTGDEIVVLAKEEEAKVEVDLFSCHNPFTSFAYIEEREDT